MIDTAEIIKDRLTMQEVAEFYGLHFDTRGRALCPFHDDHHPSATVKHERFHCYVCNLHLDAIDFVQHLFSLNYPQAVARLDSDFRLGISDKKADPRELAEWRRKRAEKEAALQAFRADYDRRTRKYRELWMALHSPSPSVWRRAAEIAELYQLQYYFDTHPWK